MPLEYHLVLSDCYYYYQYYSFVAGAELGVADGVAPDCPRRYSNRGIPVALLVVRVVDLVGGPLVLLYCIAALFVGFLVVAVRLLVALFGALEVFAAAAPAKLCGGVLASAVGLLLLVAVYFPDLVVVEATALQQLAPVLR